MTCLYYNLSLFFLIGQVHSMMEKIQSIACLDFVISLDNRFQKSQRQSTCQMLPKVLLINLIPKERMIHSFLSNLDNP